MSLKKIKLYFVKELTISVKNNNYKEDVRKIMQILLDNEVNLSSPYALEKLKSIQHEMSVRIPQNSTVFATLIDNNISFENILPIDAVIPLETIMEYIDVNKSEGLPVSKGKNGLPLEYSHYSEGCFAVCIKDYDTKGKDEQLKKYDIYQLFDIRENNDKTNITCRINGSKYRWSVSRFRVVNLEGVKEILKKEVKQELIQALTA